MSTLTVAYVPLKYVYNTITTLHWSFGGITEMTGMYWRFPAEACMELLSEGESLEIQVEVLSGHCVT